METTQTSTATNRTSHAWLAAPPGDCCLEGTAQAGIGRGEMVRIADVETYRVQPAAGVVANGHVLLYFADVWGMCANSFLVMDAFSDAGYDVLGLDYFRGDPVWKHRRSRTDQSNPGFDYEKWKAKHIAYADEAVPRWVDAVRGLYSPATKFVCVGYCFGAPYVCNELAGQTVSAGAFAHPAFLTDEHFSKIQKPLFLSCCENDHTFNAASRRAAVDLLQADGKTYQMQLFSGVEHGFALRGNMDNAYERYVKTASFEGIRGWFDFWLSGH